MRSGELYTLSRWTASADGPRVEGTGRRYSLTRVPGATGRVSIPVAEVALFETSRPESVGTGGIAALVVMTTISGVLTGICLADPKACFGSCPTFYLEGADPEGRPAAEGFSSSVARALEARDVDAIGLARGGRRYAITMRNEAFETHAVRRVRLLVAEPAEGARVVAGPNGRFHAIAEAAPPRRAAPRKATAWLRSRPRTRSSATPSPTLATSRRARRWSSSSDPGPVASRSCRIELNSPTTESLRPYARLPQGLPPGVAPAALAPAPPAPKETRR
jgi:hypothetical protein